MEGDFSGEASVAGSAPQLHDEIMNMSDEQRRQLATQAAAQNLQQLHQPGPSKHAMELMVEQHGTPQDKINLYSKQISEYELKASMPSLAGNPVAKNAYKQAAAHLRKKIQALQDHMTASTQADAYENIGREASEGPAPQGPATAPSQNIIGGG